MHIGIITMNNLEQMRLDDLARLVEDRGYESLWMGEHSHIPVSRKTDYPRGNEYLPTFVRMADPYISIAAAAAVTKTLRFGLNVSLILERELFNLAKEIATLDQLSYGRLIIGVGVGWNVEEFENVAKMPWSKRYAGMRECVAALRTLWTQDEAEFDGEWYKFDKVWSYPKPFQQPHPPIGLGVMGKLGVAHAAQWGDAWHPIDMGLKDFAPRLERFRQQVRDAGRDPAKVEVTLGNLGETVPDRLRRYREMGINRVLIDSDIYADDPVQLIDFLDCHADLNAELR